MRRVVKIFAWVLLFVIVLVGLVFLAPHIPPVQRKLVSEVKKQYKSRTGTDLIVESIYFRPDGVIELKGAVIKDERGKTFITAGKIHADIDVSSLLKGDVIIKDVRVSDGIVHVERRLDGSFNFDFLTEAFSSKSSASSGKKIFFIKNVDLFNTTFTFSDRASRLYTKMYMRSLDAKFTKFDTREQIFHIAHLNLDGGNGYMYDLSDPSEESSEQSLKKKSKQPDVFFSSAHLSNTAYTVFLKSDGMTVYNRVADLSVTTSTFDLNRSLMDFSTVAIRNGGTHVVQDSSYEKSSGSTGRNDWQIMADHISLGNVWFNYTDKTKPSQPEKGFDPANIQLSNVNMVAEKVQNVGSQIKANVHSGSLVSKDGFRIRSMKGQYFVSEQNITARNFAVRTGNSSLAGNYESEQPDYSSFSKAPSSVRYNIDLTPSKLGFADIIYFVPELDTVASLQHYKAMQASLSGEAKGTLDQLQLEQFRAGIDRSFAEVTGTLFNLDSASNLAYDLNILKSEIHSRNLPLFIPDTTIRQKFNSPELTNVTGTLKGNMQMQSFDLALKSTEGDANLKGDVSKTDYAVEGDLADLDLGHILKRKELGPLTGSVSLKGTGFHPDTMVADIQANLTNSVLFDHSYDAISGKVAYNKGHISGNVNTDDPAARLAAKGEGQYKSGLLDLKVDTRIDTLDLKATGFSKDTLSLKGNVSLTYNGTGLNNFTATGNATQLWIRKDSYLLQPDSVVLAASAKDNNLSLDLSSAIIDANITGQGQFKSLASALPGYIDSHFKISRGARRDSIPPGQVVDFSIELKNPNAVLPMFVGGVTTSPIVIKGKFNSDSRTLTASGTAKKGIYSGVAVDSLRLDINGDANGLTASVTAPRFIKSEMIFPNPSLAITARRDTLNYQVAVTGNDTVKRLLIGGIVESRGNGVYALSVDKDKFILNDKRWTVADGNQILFDSTGVHVDNLKMSLENRSLAIDQDRSDAMRLSFENFELMDLSMIPDSNRFPVGGSISGQVYLPLQNIPEGVKGNFDISNFNFRKDTLGSIAGSVTKAGENAIGLDASIIGKGNSIKLAGTYDFVDTYSPFNFTLTADQINFSSLKPYTDGVFKEINGYGKAYLTLKGNSIWPVIDGDFVIADASLMPLYTSSWIKVKQQKIHVDQSSFQLKNFLMTDSMNNPAILNGYVCPEGLPHFDFDLVMVTSNFLALNTSEGANEIYFGKALVTSISHLYGNDVTPFLDITAKLESGSRFTLMVPEQKLRMEEHDAIVQFINPEPTELKELLHKKREEPSFAGITLNSNVEVDEESQFKLLVDPVAGDSLSVKGNTTFSFGIDPGGKMTLTGVYEVTEGSYLLTMTKGLKKKFDIQRGSKITWSGNPLNPEMDVSAIYTVRAAPYDLIVGDISENDAARNSYRQEMPFLVNLKMTGALYNPTVGFNIQLPQDQQGALEGTVYARLNQLNQNESELNTQVFSLLVLNRFYNEEEFLGSQGSAIAGYTRAGMSRIVSQRLNSFATTYANFVELQLDVDFYETYYDGKVQNSTNLKVGVGKKFLSERLDVRTGGTVAVQGPPIDETGNSLPSLVTAEYKLTRDGRYRLTGFRKNTYEGVFEGQITSEGGGIVFIRDFNKFRELFRKPEERDLLDAAPRPRP